MTHLRWSLAGGGTQWSKFVSTLNHLKAIPKTHIKMLTERCDHFPSSSSDLFFPPTLPSQFLEARYQQGPLDLWWSRPLPRPAPRRLCNTPQWWWGLLKDAWLHPESPLLPPVSVRPNKEYFHFCILSTFFFFFFPTLTFLTSLTSQLTGDLLYRKAETMFFHQLYQCSVP